MATSSSLTPPAPPAEQRPPRRRRRLRLAGWGLLLLGAAAAAYCVYPYAASAYQERLARRALARLDFPDARAHLERALATHPKRASTHYLLAQTLRRSGDPDGARKHLRTAERLGLAEEQIRLEELLQQAQVGAVQPVEGRLKLHLADGSGDPDVIFEALVSGCLRCQLVDRAYQYSTLWTDRHPDSWQARYWHGRALEQGLRHDLAAEAYGKALELRPDYLDAHLRRAQMLYLRGRYQEALPHLQTYLEQRPDDKAALLALARCQYSLFPPAEARATLAQLLAQPGDHPEGWLLLGKLELAADRAAEALTWLEKAARRIPHDREVNLALATALSRLSRPDEARRFEQRHREIDRDLRRMEELTKEILTRPRDAGLRHEAGATLVRLGQDPQAIRWFVSALLLDPSHEPTRQSLAGCIERLGDPKLTEAYRPLLAPSPPRKDPLP